MKKNVCACTHTHTCTPHTHTHTHTQSHSQISYLSSCDNSFYCSYADGDKMLTNITGAGIQQCPTMCITNIVSCAQTAISYIPSQKKYVVHMHHLCVI